MASQFFLRRVVATGLIAASSAALATACGANVDDLFGRSDGSGGAGTSSGKGATHGATTNTGPGSMAGPGTGSTTGPGGPGSTTTASTTVGPTTEQSSATTTTGGGTVDCGLFQTCQISQGGCCYNNIATVGSCSLGGGCFGNDTQILCELPSDCPGQICCAQRDQANQPYNELSCLSSCDYPSLYVCNIANGDADCPTYDLGGGNIVQSICTASTFLPGGYSICKIPG